MYNHSLLSPTIIKKNDHLMLWVLFLPDLPPTLLLPWYPVHLDDHQDGRLKKAKAFFTELVSVFKCKGGNYIGWILEDSRVTTTFHASLGAMHELVQCLVRNLKDFYLHIGLFSSHHHFYNLWWQNGCNIGLYRADTCHVFSCAP